MDTTSKLAVRASAAVPLPPMQRGRSQSTAGELDPGVRGRACPLRRRGPGIRECYILKHDVALA
jgi:hypothetical protein